MHPCPRCPQTVNDSEHITKFQGTGAPEQWKQSIEQLEKWMKSSFFRAIIDGLKAWNLKRPMQTGNFSQPIEMTTTTTIKNAVTSTADEKKIAKSVVRISSRSVVTATRDASGKDRE